MTDKDILFFDCKTGVSGDMTIGALLDLTNDHAQFKNELNKLNLTGFEIKIEKRIKNGIHITDFAVIINPQASQTEVHRHLADINDIIDKSSLNDKVKELSKKIFMQVARAEAKVHGTTIGKIHFHEVGAIDSIVDIVGTAILIDMINPERIVVSPVNLGTGFVKCAHGQLPVPVPATIEILKNVPVYSSGFKGEMVTPTGAAIIKTLADEFAEIPLMEIEKTGYGNGKREYEHINILRIFIGKSVKKKITGDELLANNSINDEVIKLETNIDDMNPEIYSSLIPLLLSKGALDVYIIPIIMKKGRPANILNVICNLSSQKELENIIFKQTTTSGIRRSSLKREKLERKKTFLGTELGKVVVKEFYQGGKLLRVTPEYEECKKLAEEYSLPLIDVYQKLNQKIHEVYFEV